LLPLEAAESDCVLALNYLIRLSVVAVDPRQTVVKPPPTKPIAVIADAGRLTVRPRTLKRIVPLHSVSVQ